MENENKEKELYEQDSDNIFSFEYKGQKGKNNQIYRKWENSMFEKYGNDAKLFYCKNDDIFFYVSNKECMEYPYYSTRCPKCNYSICQICSTIKDYMYDGSCCIKRRLYYCFHEDSQEFIKHKERGDKFEHYISIFLTPYVNLIYIITCIAPLLFYKLNFKNNSDYEYGLNQLTFIIFFFLYSLFAIIISICYTFINIYFLIILWFISFPFKLIPIKFVVGILYHSGVSNYIIF